MISEDLILQKQKEIKNLSEKISVEMRNLISLIDTHLSKNPPFRDNTTFQEDVESYEKLIDYFLMTGEESFITDWGVKPLSYGYELLSSSDYGSYRSLFLKLSVEGTDKSRRVCYRKLFEFFDGLVRSK